MASAAISFNVAADPQSVSFTTIQWYAQRAKAAYETEAQIKQAFPDTTVVETVQGTQVQYFVETQPLLKRQIVTIRGTDNLANIREDADYLPSKNSKLKIYVHKGFDQDTYLVFQKLLPHLNPEYRTILTGHSLGAAISTLLMMYLHEEGFQLDQSINFGQPKVTNRQGVDAYAFLPLLRVVDENDPVPELPPATLLDSIHGSYEHTGEEVILLEQQYYVYLKEHQAKKDSVDSFWKNLGDQRIDEHYMVNYLKHIQPKLAQATPVSYDQREKYIQQ